MVKRSIATMHVAIARLQVGRTARGRRDRGATAVEYGLIVALIAVVIIVAVVFFGTSISRMFNRSATAMPT